MSYSANKELVKEDHSRILNAVLARYRASKNKMEEYEDRFLATERGQMLYMKEEALKRRPEIAGHEEVVIPYDYATVLSAHTYWTSVFLGRSPIFQFQGRHGEGEHKTQAVDALIDYQVQMGKWLPVLYAWLYDASSYPFGVICNYWAEEEVNIPTIEEVQATDEYGMPFAGKTKKVKTTRTVKSYEGNRIFNVSPREFFPDHRKPVVQCQDGEYCGRQTSLSWNDMVRRSEAGIYYNLERVKRNKARVWRDIGSTFKDFNQSPESLEGGSINYVDTVDLLEFYIEIIPADWGLGGSKSPETWRFTIADRTTIVESRPLGSLNNRFPFFVLPYDFEVHAFMGKSMYDIMEPMTRTLNWLINTHIYNVRSVLNNKIIYDPSRIVEKDLLAADSRLIRLKPIAYGTAPNTAYSQLQIQDVTTGHIRDAQLFIEMLQRTTGVVDNIMGMVNQGGRKTATEVRSSSTMGINRLKTTAEWWSATGFGPLGIAALQNTQQYMDGEQVVKIVGDIPPNGVDIMRVNPEDIMGFYDFVAVDGTLPVDRYAQANLWREMLAMMGSIPQVAQQYDIGGVFAWIAQLAGLKNVKQFKLNAMSPEVIQNEVDRGNLVPVSGGGPGGVGPGGNAGMPGRVPEPGQIPGMGSTG
ncbi:MAG: hypothetical protein HC883_01590 [Bdellovibrionaceae bacterium]|nr:hypothetical protein [Pseudobdellovibrionaceae bacterium]